MGKVGSVEKFYRPLKVEEEILRFWKENRVYEKIRENSKGKPKFYFLDGPPYPSSDVPHIGTAWNKAIKDSVIRFYRMKGYFVWDQPGYDTHGLPIEVKVEKKLGLKSKKDIVEKIGVAKFIDECRNLALTNAKLMSKRFERIGASLNWENPYFTLKPKYMESGWWLIKRAAEQNLLMKGIKVVWWCPRCETVLADYEVQEYREIEDPSIFVKLPLENRDKEYLLIWTTTPWTLPANMAVMVHPDLDYVKVEYKDEKLILAKVRLKYVFEKIGEKPKIIEEFKGKTLEGLRYIPPLLEEVMIQKKLRNKRTHKVVLSEYVTPYEGTGLVHTAPGHGEEDYEIGIRYSLPIASPVDEHGRFTEEAGKYKGIHVREANKLIIDDLKRKGLLFHAETITHKYPVCWRCKTPLVLRATEQWYITVTKLKDKMLEEAEKIEWIPSWAKERFKNWLKELRDWVISRQRYWGIPLPIWECEKCGHRYVSSSVDDLKKLAINNVSLEDLHKPWIDEVKLKCPKCGSVMKRVPDVLDVWFDSGISFYASLYYPRHRDPYEKLKPVDFIVEGHDQIAGWFFSLLRSGVIGFGEAPYRKVAVHGYMLDEKGREMHKSLGNYVSVDEVVDRYGADTLRFWLLQNTIWEDIRFSWKKLGLTIRDLNILWNIYVFASTYMSLDKYDPTLWNLDKVRKWLRFEDKWMLSRLNRLLESVEQNMEKILIHEAVRSIRNFVVEDLSHWYIRLIRRRVWIEAENPDKIAVYTVLYNVLKQLLIIMAPIIPFLTESLYQQFVRPAEPSLPISVHMLSWPKFNRLLISDEIEKHMEIAKKIVEAAAATRMKAGIKIRQPLPELIVFSDEEELKRAMPKIVEIISSQINVKKVEIKPLSETKHYMKYVIKPVYSELGPLLKEKIEKALEILNKESSRVAESILSKGVFEFTINNEKYLLTKKHIEIAEMPLENYVMNTFEYGRIALNIRTDMKIVVEGLARDLIRRIQFMRKELDLPVDAYVNVTISVYDPVIIEMLKEWKEFIAEEVRAKVLNIVMGKLKGIKGYIREWEINDEKYVIVLTPLK